MGFAKIGAWIDNKVSGANQTWQGSGTKRTVDRLASKTKEVVTDTADKVNISATQAKDNFNGNMAEVNTKTEGKGFFSKAMEVGKSGGLMGMAFKKPAGSEDTKPTETPASPPPLPQTGNTETPAAPPPLPQKGIMDDVKAVAGKVTDTVTETAGKVTGYVKETVQETAAKIPTTASQAKDNFKANMEEVKEETKGQSFLGKMWKVGKSGGLIGMMKNRPEPKKEEKTVEQHDGWNVKG